MIEAEAMDGGDGAREGEDNGNIRSGIDPFVQPPILKVFFEQLPLEELAKCRLVSKLWCKESLSTWRSKATLKFGEEGIVSSRADGSSLTTSLGEFLDLWDAGEWGSCPFKKLSLESWTFEAEDVDLEQDRFMELMGSHVTSLTLKRCWFFGREYFRRIIYLAFPNLQFLKIERCWTDGEETDESEDDSDEEDKPEEEILSYKEPVFGLHGLRSLDIVWCDPLDSMMDMLSHFHKLKSLHMKIGRREYRSLLEVIRLIRSQDQSKLPLKNFDVNVHLELGQESRASSIKLLKLHEQLKLPLQRLTIDFDPEEDEEMDWDFNDVLTDILRQHSSTLKYLEFSGDGPPGLCKSFPYGFCLQNLVEFSIQSPCFTDNLNYLRYTPNLRELDIAVYTLSTSDSDNLFSNSTQLEIGDWTLPSLTDLKLGFPVSPCNVRKLVKWMPNLERSWGLELDDVILAMVCEKLKNLKYLKDDGKELTDAGVIGIGNAHESGDDEGTQSVPNITKLKNLISFVTCSSKLTSASVHEGFLKLANLENLALGHSTKLDDDAKAALEKRNIALRIR